MLDRMTGPTLLLDDIVSPGLVNGDFEAMDLTGWMTIGSTKCSVSPLSRQPSATITATAPDHIVSRNNLGAPAGTPPNDTNGGVLGQEQYDT